MNQFNELISADQVTAQIAQLSARLVAESRQLVTAESCTGGWLAKVMTDRAGSSAWYRGGVVVYSNELKMRLLGVQSETLAAHGAVSEATVREMALGALRQLGGDVAAATSGIAGPDGGTATKPVGTVWCAWAWRDGGDFTCQTRCFCFAGDRESVRWQAVHAVLAGLLDSKLRL